MDWSGLIRTGRNWSGLIKDLLGLVRTGKDWT